MSGWQLRLSCETGPLNLAFWALWALGLKRVLRCPQARPETMVALRNLRATRPALKSAAAQWYDFWAMRNQHLPLLDLALSLGRDLLAFAMRASAARL